VEHRARFILELIDSFDYLGVIFKRQAYFKEDGSMPSGEMQGIVKAGLGAARRAESEGRVDARKKIIGLFEKVIEKELARPAVLAIEEKRLLGAIQPTVEYLESELVLRAPRLIEGDVTNDRELKAFHRSVRRKIRGNIRELYASMPKRKRREFLNTSLKACLRLSKSIIPLPHEMSQKIVGSKQGAPASSLLYVSASVWGEAVGVMQSELQRMALQAYGGL